MIRIEPDYGRARRQFLALAHDRKGVVSSIIHPAVQGPCGEDLSIDAVRIGQPDAKRVLLMISGLHGVEGPAGSLMQRMLLGSLDHEQPPPDLAIVLIHAANPYGWAHATRGDENFVDLNRNFTRFAGSSAIPSLQAQLYAAYCDQGVDQSGLMATRQAMAQLSRQHGAAKVMSAFSSQYHFSDGIHFGGSGPAWSAMAITRLADDLIGDAELVGIIDWHTGLGEYGRPFFLCFFDQQEPAFAEAKRWWGGAIEQTNRGFSHGARPEYQGLLVSALATRLQAKGVAVTGAVIEFGTHSNRVMLEALLKDRWARFRESCPNARATLQAEVRQAFGPIDSTWEMQIAKHGSQIMTAAMRGLISAQLPLGLPATP